MRELSAVAGAPGGVAAMACAAVCPMSWHLPRFLPGMQAKVPAQARQRVLAEKLFLPGTPEAPALPEKKMNVNGRIVKMRPWTVSGGFHEQKLIRSFSSFTHLEGGLSRIPLQPGNPGFPAPVKSRKPGEKAPPSPEKRHTARAASIPKNTDAVTRRNASGAPITREPRPSPDIRGT